MASVDIKKLHGAEAMKILGHDSRWDGRKGVDYTNTHINPELTHTNAVRCFKGMPKDETSKETFDRLTNRVKELDELKPPKRIRKDRVTMIAFEIPVPENLQPELESQFFSIAYREFAKMCGSSANISKLYIHRDEQHEYVDPVTKEIKTSRVHAHAVGIPWTEEYGVNAKHFCTKESFRNLQQRIHDKCKSELGVDFLDGSGRKSRATMEQLKIASAKESIALEREARERSQRLLESLEQLKRDKSTIEQEKADIERSTLELKEREEAYNQKAKEAYNRLLEVLKDERYNDSARTVVAILKDDYPDIWQQLAIDLDNWAVPIEDIEHEPSMSLQEINERVAMMEPWDSDPDIDEFYPVKSHDDHDGR